MPDDRWSGLQEQPGNELPLQLFAFDHLCAYTEVFNTAIIAGAKERFVNLDAAGFLSRNHIVNKVWFRYN